MKNSLLAILLLLSGSIFAQDLSISGLVTDNQTNTPLPGAHISLLHPWGEAYKTTVSETDGKFVIKNLSQGGYALKVSFIGYDDFTKEVTVSGENVNLGTIALSQGVQLSEVEVKAKLPMAEQIGDTTQFNADAFKVMKDASAEEMVEKLPGVVVDGGKVQAQGEDVKEVLVDGRPFFGNDPTAALRNLPAEVIDKIQVFDKKSDQATFSGFDDGETTKTINIITRPNMRNGQFGKVYAGYGYEDKYQVGGNASIFDGKRRISLIGQANNINQQNFSTEDLLGVVGSSGRRGRGGRGGGRGGSRGGRGGGSVGDFLIPQQGGIATTNAAGINYSDKWGEDFDITGSYFFNRSDNDSRDESTTQFITREGTGEIYDELTTTTTENFNHRMNFRINYKLDSLNSFTMRPRISFQDNSGISETMGETFLGTQILNETDNTYDSDLSGIDFSNSLFWRHRFRDTKNTFSINFGQQYNNKKGDAKLYSQNVYYDGFPNPDTLDQFSNLDLDGWKLNTSISYTNPIGERSRISLNYRASWQEDNSDKETFDFNNTTLGYNDLNENLTNIFKNNYYSHQFGGGYNWSKGRDFFVMARANMQYSKLESDQTFPTSQLVERSFLNVLPMLMVRRRVSKTENFMAMYRTSTQSPSVEQLQNVIDNSNPIQLAIGNSSLDQSFNHRLFARYSKTNTEKATAFFFLISGSFSDNYIGNSTYLSETANPIFDDIDLLPGAQLSRPVNLKGYWNGRIYSTYGIPLSKIKTNLNIDVNLNYSKTPGLIDDRLNYSKNRTVGLGLTLASNISEKVDFTISTRSNLTDTKNTLQRNTNDAQFLNQTSKVKLNVLFPGGIILRTNASHNYYTGLADGFDDSFFLWTVGLGKKLFKNERGEITLSVFDMLEQNQSISRNVTETYIEDLRSMVLQRYAMLTFTYNFRNFNTGKKQTQNQGSGDWEKKRREQWQGRN
jgi:hypothetical protein